MNCWIYSALDHDTILRSVKPRLLGVAFAQLESPYFFCNNGRYRYIIMLQAANSHRYRPRLATPARDYIFTEAASTSFLEAVYFSFSSSTPWLPVSQHRDIGFVRWKAPSSILLHMSGEEGGRDWFIAMLCCSLSHAPPPCAASPNTRAVENQLYCSQTSGTASSAFTQRESSSFWHACQHFKSISNIEYSNKYVRKISNVNFFFNLPHHRDFYT